MKRSPIHVILVVVLLGAVLCATSTIFTEPWATTLDSWTWTQLTCTGTCTAALVTADGNPADSVNFKVTGRSKVVTGTWDSANKTWAALGVPAGDTVNSVTFSNDDKAVSTAVACVPGSSSTFIQPVILPVGGGPNCAVGAVVSVAGDSTWTTHAGSAISVAGTCSTSSQGIILELDGGAASGNNSSAACEVRNDNWKITIVSSVKTVSPGLMMRGVGAHVTEFVVKFPRGRP